MDLRDDLDLATALATDLEAGFPALVAGLAGPVYSVALRLCGRDRAEDVAQETFTRAYRALQGYPAGRRRALQVRPWVLTIALNVARNELRSASRGPEENGKAPADRLDPGLGPEAAAERSELRERLAAALRQLPAASREAVVLRHVVGCRVTEVAAILDRPVGTVKAQVWRGLAALRQELESDGRGNPWEDR